MNLSLFNTDSLFEAATSLFSQLGIRLNSNTAEPLPIKGLLQSHYKDNDTFRIIEATFFIGIIDDSVFKQAGMFDLEYTLKEALQQADKNYDGLMLFALELKKHPTRTEISDLTRAFNRISQKMPVALVLKYTGDNEAIISIAISERFKYKQNWRQGEKAGKVIILRDIHTTTTHTGHQRILLDLVKPAGINTYEQLHAWWLQALDVNLLNKKFYREVFDWYLWAFRYAKFPQIRPEEDMLKNEQHQSESLIRLLTRLLFCWFMKEKKLISEQLFNKAAISEILINMDEDDSTYYKAILQNLFFATLNKPVDERKVINEGFNPVEYGDPLVYRYKQLFKQPENLVSYFQNIPFLNGGLFDCLDRKKDNKNPHEIRLDGFSTKPSKQPVVPNKLFFGHYTQVDLSREYDDRKKSGIEVRGIIDIFSSYKFTIEESTPVEEEIALDPELLGKVFENLLASYNPETKTTARKQTGSFYTPREIVNYMVDESLLEYLKGKLPDGADYEAQLRSLIGYDSTETTIDEQQKKQIIQAINNCRVLDPACGSGAFPMGVLQRMIHILKKIDPDNRVWLEMVISNFPDYLQNEMRQKLSVENWDYVRKLGIIQECIYGIDIQPIAIQISKLRFFISLLVDQKEKPGKPNRGFDPLPNLDFKLVAANTLIGAPQTETVTTGLFSGTEDEFETLFKKLTSQYFSTYKPEEKKQKKDEIEKLINAKVNEKINQVKSLYDSADARVQDALKAKKKTQIDRSENDIRLWKSYTNLFKHESVGFFDTRYFFPQIGEGFDILIGNPPYGGSYSDAEKQYFKRNYQSAKTIANIQKGSLDTFTLFIEQGFNSLKKNGFLTFIVPIAITSSESMTGIHGLLENNCEVIKISSYSVRPQPIFQNAVVNTSILSFSKTNTKCQRVLATKMYRKNNDLNLEHLVNNLEFIDVFDYKLIGRYPKISYNIERKILEKIFYQKTSIGEIIKKTGTPIYYRTTGGRYYKVITNYSTGSTKETSILFDSEISDSIGAILSSNLYFWFYQIYSNNLDLKFYEIESFKIPLEKLTENTRIRLQNLYNNYLKDIEKNSNIRKTTNYANIESFREYKIGKSKALIDKIDDLICPIYGLTHEETTFIKNYEIEFRLTDE